MLTLDGARANATPIDWTDYAPPAPARRGVHVLDDYDLGELRDYIDWQPFFNAWEMKGRFPDILNNPTTGETARKLYDDAQADARPDRRGAVADRPRRRTGSSRPTASATTSRSTPTTRASEVLATLHHLRQQGEHRAGRPQPGARRLRGAARRPGWRDHVGGFAVTAGHGHPRADRGVQGRPRRLLRDPARVAGRPAGRGLRRAAAPARAHRVLGPRRRTRRWATTT